MPILSVGKTSRGGTSSGVTLMEMLVVMAIIALLAGISFPSISSGIDSVRLRSATDSLAAFLNSAVTRSERRQQPVELVISVKKNSLAAFSNEAGYQPELKLPDGISLEGVLPKEEEGGDPRRVILLPGGTIPGIGIQIANQHGSRRIVRLDPMTGFPRVENVSTK